MRPSPTCLAVAFATVIAPGLAAQTPAPIPQIVGKDGRNALMVDGAPFLVLGVQAHNSSAWPALLPRVWPAVQDLHANILEVPVYWEQLEPESGRFDYSVVDTLIKEAREHHVRLILLWFGTWKNGSPHYVPAFGFGNDPPGNPEPVGRALVAALGENEFLVTGAFCPVDFQLADAARKSREFVRVEEGGYEDGAFRPVRIWNGDETDWGSNFSSGPQALRVSFGTY